MFMPTPLGAYILRMAHKRGWAAAVIPIQGSITSLDFQMTGYQAFATSLTTPWPLTGVGTIHQASRAVAAEIARIDQFPPRNSTLPEAWHQPSR